MGRLRTSVVSSLPDHLYRSVRRLFSPGPRADVRPRDASLVDSHPRPGTSVTSTPSRRIPPAEQDRFRDCCLTLAAHAVAGVDDDAAGTATGLMMGLSREVPDGKELMGTLMRRVVALSRPSWDTAPRTQPRPVAQDPVVPAAPPREGPVMGSSSHPGVTTGGPDDDVPMDVVDPGAVP